MKLSKYLFLIVLALIIISGLLMFTSHNGFVLRLMDLIFLLLSAATVLYIKESKTK